VIDGQTTQHKGYKPSQGKRKLIEQIFGWIKTTGRLRKTGHRGASRARWRFIFTVAVFDLFRIRTLGAVKACGHPEPRRDRLRR